MPEMIEFDDVTIRLDAIAVIAHVKEDGDKFSYFIQSTFGKLTKHTADTFEEAENHRKDLILKLEAM